MKVLHIGKYYHPFRGGIENFLRELVRVQTKSGHEVLVLAHHHEPFRRFISEFDGSTRIWKIPILGRLLYTPISPLFPIYLRRALKEFCPDLVHIHMPNVSGFWILLRDSETCPPLVIHWHSDVITHESPKSLVLAYRFYRPLEQRLLADSWRILATSPNYLNSSEPLANWVAKSLIVPLGLPDTNPASESIAGKDRADSIAIRIICIGRLSHYKGHIFLIRAAARVPECELLIVGDGEERRRLEKEITALDAGDRIKLLGRLDDSELFSLLNASDCLCLPSVERTEAFGLVLLEAMRAGKAVIASHIEGSGISWVIEDGVSGILTDKESENSLISAIRRLRDDPDFCHRLGRNGRQRFAEIFKISQVAGLIDKIYQQRP